VLEVTLGVLLANTVENWRTNNQDAKPQDIMLQIDHFADTFRKILTPNYETKISDVIPSNSETTHDDRPPWE
jgi:hypothetical protein